MTFFNLPGFARTVKPANQNKVNSGCDRGRRDEIAKPKSNQPEAFSSAWYHDLAIKEELGLKFGRKP
ncbi:DUF2735 domain-containing protein [Methylorubrum populi]|nr:DUF2735 domain-containing protein [Methylorubrum populi]